MSHARSSSAVGARPTPYFGDCARSELPQSTPASSSTQAENLRVPIPHAPIAGDPPWLNRVVQTRNVEGVQRNVEELGRLRARRLHLAEFIGTSRKQFGLLTVPIPLVAESAVRHPLRRPLDLRFVPALAAVGGNLHPANRSTT